MPLYEYECKKCGSVFEVLQKLSDPPLAAHIGCGGEVERLISTSAFHFKGSGWYVTDYAKGTDKAKRASEKPSADGKPGAADKPAAPAETKKETPKPAAQTK